MQLTSWRLCSFTLVFPTNWKKILFHDEDAAFFKTSFYKSLPLLFMKVFIFLSENLVDPAIEEGVLGKVHQGLLRREAGAFLHSQVFLAGLHPSQLGLVQLVLWSKVIPLTDFLHTRESLPVSGLKLDWMSILFSSQNCACLLIPFHRGAPAELGSVGSSSWDSLCSAVVVHIAWD